MVGGLVRHRNPDLRLFTKSGVAVLWRCALLEEGTWDLDLLCLRVLARDHSDLGDLFCWARHHLLFLLLRLYRIRINVTEGTC